MMHEDFQKWLSPAILLVHGFWGGAAHWNKVIVQLSDMG